MLLVKLSEITTFKYYNYVFDGIILLAALIFLIAGLKRGLGKTIWCLLFDIVSLGAAYLTVSKAYPLISSKLPIFGENFLKGVVDQYIASIAIAYAYEILVFLLVFVILRYVLFKLVLKGIDEYRYTYQKKTNFVGRIVAGLASGMLAASIATGGIIVVKDLTGTRLFKNYDSEVSETYVAKYALNSASWLLDFMEKTDSIESVEDILIKIATHGDYNEEKLPYFKTSILDLRGASDANTYLIKIGANTSGGLVRMSQDLQVWAILAKEADKATCNRTYEALAKPIVSRCATLGYIYSGDKDSLPDLTVVKEVSPEVYASLKSIYKL